MQPNENISISFVLFSADKEDNFDKWSRCVMNSKIPTNNEEIEVLIERLKKLAKSK